MHGLESTCPAFETASGYLIPVKYWRDIFDKKIQLKQFQHNPNKPIRCEILLIGFSSNFYSKNILL